MFIDIFESRIMEIGQSKVHQILHGVEKSMKYEKKCLALGPIFSDKVYPKDHKNTQMKIFHACPG